MFRFLETSTEYAPMSCDLHELRPERNCIVHVMRSRLAICTRHVYIKSVLGSKLCQASGLYCNPYSSESAACEHTNLLDRLSDNKRHKRFMHEDAKGLSYAQAACNICVRWFSKWERISLSVGSLVFSFRENLRMSWRSYCAQTRLAAATNRLRPLVDMQCAGLELRLVYACCWVMVDDVGIISFWT